MESIGSKVVRHLISRRSYLSSRGACVLVLALIFLLWGTYARCGEENKGVTATIEKFGGKIRRDSDGNLKSIVFVRKLTDSVAESIDFSSFEHLRGVTLYSCEITGRSFERLNRIPNLMHISFISSKITDDGLARFLKHQKSLTALACHNTAITDNALIGIEAAAALQILEFKKVRISDKGLREIAKLKQLFALEVSRTEITDIGLAEIAKISSLTFLCLDRTNVTDAGIQQLGALANLRSLEMRSTKVSDDGVKALQTRLPNLEVTR